MVCFTIILDVKGGVLLPVLASIPALPPIPPEQYYRMRELIQDRSPDHLGMVSQF
jgi:hypothetical protein